MSGDTLWIGEDPVDRGECRQRWKDREQAVVGHAGGESEDAVLGDVAVDPQQDVLPSAQRNLGGRGGEPPAVIDFRSDRRRGGVPAALALLGKIFVFVGLRHVGGRSKAIPKKCHR